MIIFKYSLIFQEQFSLGEHLMQQTHWHVITGAPCSGKTAVICELERRGYPVVHEAARAYIHEELQKGKTMAQIKGDILAFERHILYQKIEIEQSLSKDATVFLDRAIPDSIGYYLLEGLNPDDPIQKSGLWRYKNIFFFERITFEIDTVRSEDDEIAAALDGLLKKSYQMLGYEIISVPLMTVEDRVDFILKHL
jgi:predicted ATPase